MNNFQYPYNQNMFNMQGQNLIRVNGQDGARAYQMTPNSSVALFDANDDLMYIKTTDGAGFGSIRTFRFEEVNKPTETKTSYVTREELEEYVKQHLQSNKPKTNNQQRTNGND